MNTPDINEKETPSPESSDEAELAAKLVAQKKKEEADFSALLDQLAENA